MAARVHPGWLRPIPHWYQDFAWKDSIPDDPVPTGGNLICETCGQEFEPRNKCGRTRRYCYSRECELSRKREFMELHRAGRGRYSYNGHGETR